MTRASRPALGAALLALAILAAGPADAREPAPAPPAGTVAPGDPRNEELLQRGEELRRQTEAIIREWGEQIEAIDRANPRFESSIVHDPTFVAWPSSR